MREVAPGSPGAPEQPASSRSPEGHIAVDQGLRQVSRVVLSFSKRITSEAKANALFDLLFPLGS